MEICERFTEKIELDDQIWYLECSTINISIWNTKYKSSKHTYGMMAQVILSLEYPNWVRLEEALRIFKTSKIRLIACSGVCISYLQLLKIFIKINKQHTVHRRVELMPDIHTSIQGKEKCLMTWTIIRISGEMKCEERKEGSRGQNVTLVEYCCSSQWWDCV